MRRMSQLAERLGALSQRTPGADAPGSPWRDRGIPSAYNEGSGNEAHCNRRCDMRRIKNILVAVDLSDCDRLVSYDLPAPTQEAVDRALWLAKLNSARLRFLYVLDVSPNVQRMIEKSDGGSDTVLAAAEDALAGLAAQAAAVGVSATTEVRYGKSWYEVIRRVLEDHHDLVVAGTRRLGGASGLLIGSTGVKLLRKCPCPVWITRPHPAGEERSILAAHDLSPVGDTVMELACSMAQLDGSRLHVLHALDAAAIALAPPDTRDAEEAEQRALAKEHIERQLTAYHFAEAPHVHITAGEPAALVMELIDRHSIDLLVMGTIARAGIAGLLIGNTAERLLPQLPCSVLAVKPEGFVSPVQA